MIIGTLLTMAFLFAYTQVKNNAQNAGFTSAINFCLVRTVFPSLYTPVCLHHRSCRIAECIYSPRINLSVAGQ